MNKRQTRQKKLIYEALKSSKKHPTVKDIYENLKNDGHLIGRATVYRNVNDLVDSGDVKSLNYGKNCHYDANDKQHCHFVCKACGKIIDIFDESIENVKKMKIDDDVIVEDFDVTLYGICSDCKN